MGYLTEIMQNKSTRNYLLSEAGMRGDLPTIFNLLADGANCNARDEEGYALVHLAVRHSKVEVLRLLQHLNLPVDWNARDPEGKTAFYIAVGAADHDCLKFLATHEQVDHNIAAFNGQTPAMYAQQFEETDEFWNILYSIRGLEWPWLSIGHYAFKLMNSE